MSIFLTDPLPQTRLMICSACEAESSSPVPGKGEYTASKCMECGLVQTSPVPSIADLEKFYHAFGFLPPHPAKMRDDCDAIERSLLYHLGPPIADSKFLDFGGGYGLYAKAAENLGWEVCLFDYDQGALSFAEEVLELANVTGQTSNLESGKFDIIWAFHVAEHWRSIDDELNEIDRLLKPSGRIILATPNAKSWEKYIRPSHFLAYLRSWRMRGLATIPALKQLLRFDSLFCWDPPRHLFAYTPESFEAIASRRGYTCEVIVGPNSSELFEPRKYVIGNSKEDLRLLGKEIARKPWKLGSARALLSIVIQQTCFKILNHFLPKGGEQLYVVYSKR